MLDSSEKISKRSILAEIAKLFDPVGWLSPVIICAKLMLQNLWLQGVSWDETVPPSLSRAWLTFRKNLPEVEAIKIPRWFGTLKTTDWQLHGFCDASERAFAATIYLVFTSESNFYSNLISAKSKVAPIKTVSVPKLELCGAVLLSRLITGVLHKLPMPPSRIHCWSESKVVLVWLHSHPSRWKPFVANRVSEIVTSLPQATWRHVRSADNPADLATRGCTLMELRESVIWWHGPEWLKLQETDWPSETNPNKDTDLEARKKDASCVFLVQETEAISSWLSQFSSVDKPVRVLAFIYRWRDNAKLERKDRRVSFLSAAELSLGRAALLRVVQREAFGKEYEELSSKRCVSLNSPLRRLMPYLDSERLIRVSGRLQNSCLSESEKYPIILPKQHHVTALLIRQAHLDTLHGGPLLVQSHLSRQYWILRGRNVIRSVVRQCVKCTRYNAITQEQLMGPLPAVRSRPARPFSCTGLDYIGPFWIKASGGRGQKAFKGYVAIFICMVVKAVHLEVVSDYTSAAFLAAFARFVARRGLCKTLYSDNGTNFRGADAELRRLFDSTAAMSQSIAAEIAKDGVAWTYNPPRAPNFGGHWEANVKSFKRHLQRVVGDTKLTYEEFSTVVARIETCLNSRPLSAFSSNEEDVSALTPGHFLIGAPMVSPPEPFLEINEASTVCSRWSLLRLMGNHFWKRWRAEFLCQAQHRAKWLRPNYALKPGDLVLFKDELTPPSKWPLARISALYPGVDGLNRVATIRTATSEYKRPINKLILLPVNTAATTSRDQLALQVATAGGAVAPSTAKEDPDQPED